MKLQVGKFYITADGEIVGPIGASNFPGPFWFGELASCKPDLVVETFRADGRVERGPGMRSRCGDLVAEAFTSPPRNP
ncbi:hypothetical protein [Mesorhizobium sp. J8]|uniref:hypothetical protein n=1 Tax=Mesorhizobium sp. J8 TaxID=2777475 RepID=UPI00191599D3|nr:hypothetical protein [Mesorhizobium sp. J8]